MRYFCRPIAIENAAQIDISTHNLSPASSSFTPAATSLCISAAHHTDGQRSTTRTLRLCDVFLPSVNGDGINDEQSISLGFNPEF
ncbi:hypothetical protein PPTG_23274 [Phytophthora nicotianae INRA-310]|uniref:Uncharacterized protein n=1 Tax=Phytophthora nicotianae (strain INRA-310) TaxID=761204 RepID=W2Q2R8_PHYN3|nr:hypothetical protein PPTG_23274 [Phytophthora nicotianae INRA-310]ETN06809.1 hypothetical protein PPTG_23274 [Phytophthora nicotianae INRA-310]